METPHIHQLQILIGALSKGFKMHLSVCKPLRCGDKERARSQGSKGHYGDTTSIETEFQAAIK